MLDLQKQVMPLLIAGRGPKREYNTSAVHCVAKAQRDITLSGKQSHIQC